ncbi:unnamed protein product [Phaeothamnion confervicola]
MATAAGSFAELSRAAELKRHEASVLAARRERSVHSQLEGKLEKTQAALDEAQEEARRAAAAGAEASTRRDRLQAEASSFKEKREGLLRAVEKRVAAAKTNAAKATEAARVQQQRLQVARREAKQLASEGSAAAQQAEAADAAAKAAAAEVEAMEAAVAAKRAAYATAEEAATARRVEVAELAAVQQALAKERRELADGLEAAGEEQKEHARQAKESGRKSANAAHQRKVLLHNHKWIQQDQRFFGSAGTDFDFSGYEYEKETQEVDDLRQSQKDKERTINKKVVGLIEKLEKEYEELVRKRGIIVNDKAKIEKVIDNLNDKKKEALQTTWVKVNRDFGSIFSTLLPGTSAKVPRRSMGSRSRWPSGTSGRRASQSCRAASGRCWRCRSSWRCCSSSRRPCTSWTRWTRRSTCRTRRTSGPCCGRTFPPRSSSSSPSRRACSTMPTSSTAPSSSTASPRCRAPSTWPPPPLLGVHERRGAAAAVRPATPVAGGARRMRLTRRVRSGEDWQAAWRTTVSPSRKNDFSSGNETKAENGSERRTTAGKV